MREFFLNPDFDRSLGGGASLLESEDPTYAHEMAWHFLFAADPGDRVIVHAPVPEGFRSYIRAKGLALPETTLHPGFTPEAEFVPFGWNAHASALAARYARPSRGPEAAAVRTANSRAFALGLEREWYGDECEGRLVPDYRELTAFLAGRPSGEQWLAKGDHGYAGTGNVRVAGGTPSAADAARLLALFGAHGRVVLEPWHDRVRDLAVLFRVAKDGQASGFRGHGLINSRDGAFLGVEAAPDRLPPEEWRVPLMENARRLAGALAEAGYAGPVGVDAYVHRSQGGLRLRPLVDVNARLSMALPAHGLAARLPGRYLRWSWHKPRKLRLPESYAGLDDRLGASAFDPVRGAGILAASPLFREDGGGTRPKRVGFALVSETPEGLEALQGDFSRALGRGT